MKVNTLANKITISRILVAPIIIITLLEHRLQVTLILLGFCFVTDLLDGFVARWKKEVSTLGSYLDSIADKMLLTSVYLTLAYLDMVDMWVFVVVFSRDMLIVLGWCIIFILTQSSEISHRPLGKAATGFQMITALGLIIRLPHEWMMGLIWLMVGVTISSTIDYIVQGEKRLGKWA